MMKTYQTQIKTRKGWIDTDEFITHWNKRLASIKAAGNHCGKWIRLREVSVEEIAASEDELETLGTLTQ
jgi:hypothetical protein